MCCKCRIDCLGSNNCSINRECDAQPIEAPAPAAEQSIEAVATVKVASVGPLSVAEVEADPIKFPYEEIVALWSSKDGAVSNRHSQRTALAKLLRLSDSMFAVQIRSISSGVYICAKLIYCIVLCVSAVT